MVIADAIIAWDRDGRLYPVGIQGAEGAALLPGMTPEQRMESFHVVDPDGTVHSGGPALPYLFSLLPNAGPLVALLRATAPINDRGYRFGARHRMAISKAVPGRLKARARARLLP